MYGLETQGIPASEAFDKQDGRGAMADGGWHSANGYGPQKSFVWRALVS